MQIGHFAKNYKNFPKRFSRQYKKIEKKKLNSTRVVVKFSLQCRDACIEMQENKNIFP